MNVIVRRILTAVSAALINGKKERYHHDAFSISSGCVVDTNRIPRVIVRINLHSTYAALSMLSVAKKAAEKIIVERMCIPLISAKILILVWMIRR